LISWFTLPRSHQQHLKLYHEDFDFICILASRHYADASHRIVAELLLFRDYWVIDFNWLVIRLQYHTQRCFRIHAALLSPPCNNDAINTLSRGTA
jgi:hypothetical protein